MILVICSYFIKDRNVLCYFIVISIYILFFSYNHVYNGNYYIKVIHVIFNNSTSNKK